MKKEIVVQFSGGIDSLYVAYMLASKYDRVHLLTFEKGYLHFALGANKFNVDVLKKHFGNHKIVHHIIQMKPLFKKMAVKTYRDTKNKYGNEVAWCIPCRASMAIMTVIYAIENDIAEFTDGANWEQTPDGKKILATADNFPEFLDSIKQFAAAFHVRYSPVLYELNTRKERRDELIRIGAKIDFNSMERTKKSIWDVFNPDFYKRAQPMCLSGYFIHWKRNFFNVKEEVTGQKVADSIQPKLENIGKVFIKDYFDSKGISLEDKLEERRKDT